MIRLTNIPEGKTPEAPKPRTFEYWVLEELPPEYAVAAIENFHSPIACWTYNKDREFSSAPSALYNGFSWESTSQGHAFWLGVWRHLDSRGRTPLPPLEGD